MFAPAPTSSSGQWWGHTPLYFCQRKWGCLEDTLKSWAHKSTQACYNACTLMLLLWRGFEMLIWRFPHCCLLPVGGVGVNCNVWGWTLIHIHWGRAGAGGDPPTGRFCQRPILSGPPPATLPPLKGWNRGTLACSSPCCCCCCLASPTHSSRCEGPIAAGVFV